jgi:hypothetical protein
MIKISVIKSSNGVYCNTLTVLHENLWQHLTHYNKILFYNVHFLMYIQFAYISGVAIVKLLLLNHWISLISTSLGLENKTTQSLHGLWHTHPAKKTTLQNGITIRHAGIKKNTRMTNLTAITSTFIWSKWPFVIIIILTAFTALYFHIQTSWLWDSLHVLMVYPIKLYILHQYSKMPRFTTSCCHMKVKNNMNTHKIPESISWRWEFVYN